MPRSSRRPGRQEVAQIDVDKLRTELARLERREAEVDAFLDEALLRSSSVVSQTLSLSSSNPSPFPASSSSSSSSSSSRSVSKSADLTASIASKIQHAHQVFDQESAFFHRAHTQFRSKISEHVQTIVSISDEVGRLDSLQGNCDAVMVYIDDFVELTNYLETVSKESSPDSPEEQAAAIAANLDGAVDLVVKFNALSQRSMYRADPKSTERMRAYQHGVEAVLVDELKAAIEESCGSSSSSSVASDVAQAHERVKRLALLLGRVLHACGKGAVVEQRQNSTATAGKDNPAVERGRVNASAVAFLPTLVDFMKPAMHSALASAGIRGRNESDGDERSNSDGDRTTTQSLVTIEAHEHAFRDLLNLAHGFIRRFGLLVLNFGSIPSSRPHDKSSASDSALVDARHAALQEIVGICDLAGAELLGRGLRFIDEEVKRMIRPNGAASGKETSSPRELVWPGSSGRSKSKEVQEHFSVGTEQLHEMDNFLYFLAHMCVPVGEEGGG